MNYYNEFDPKAAAWLRELIKQGHIAPGVVDERSIEDVKPGDLDGYKQCHFFAGIGGWSLALRLAGWPDDQPVWTGSCPCQPFSAAGKRTGFDDQRHLWPAFLHLIREQRPRVVFGEQVASSDGLLWLDVVQADLEGAAYANAAIDLCAAGIGAPHIRQRLYWVADTDLPQQHKRTPGGKQSVRDQGGADREGMEYPARIGREEWRAEPGWRRAELRRGTDGIGRPIEPGIEPLAHGVPFRMDLIRGYGNGIVPHLGAEFIAAYQETKQQAMRTDMTPTPPQAGERAEALDSLRLDWLEAHDDPAIEGPFQHMFPSERWIVRHRNHTVSRHATIRDAIDAAIAALDSEESK